MFYLRLDENSLMLAAHHRSSQSESEGRTPVCLQQALSPTLPLEQQLRQLRAGHPTFARSASMQVLVVGPSTLVPLAEFDEEQCENIYRFCVLGEEKSKSRLRVFYDLLPSSNLALLFALNEEKCQAIEAEFGEVYYVSHITAPLRHLSGKVNPMHRHRVYLHCRETAVDIAIFEDQRLLALNTFPTLTVKDAAYYTFALMQTLGLTPDATPIATYGCETVCEATTRELQKYAPQTGQLYAIAEHHRHPVAQIEGIPFDFATQIIQSK